jgi:outer membrane lipoprotein SlyB
MENNKTQTRMHPLVAGAAISVMLASLTGVAALTGLIPSSHSTNAGSHVAVADSIGSAAAAASPAALVEPRSEQKSVPIEPSAAAPKPAPQTAKSSRPAQGSYAGQSVAQAPAICHSCGRVESVQTIKQPAKASGVGVGVGAVVGGLLGNQVGGGNGRTLATVAGAVGGGYAGNEIEKQARATVSYQVRVRMENGSIRTFPYAQQPGWATGDRVRVVNGQLTSRA